ncbi:MAG: carbohydrate ABC transporter permease [Armatimonadota bacterium]|nr:carbohydrate ABC transporter permease [Armatimonadota bacterium]MDR7550405.1 carbohydrate ABC transporter permease [Armatimonadota bacterium]
MIESRPSGRPGAAAVVARYAMLAALAAFTTFPLLWLASVALRTTGAVFAFPPQLVPWPPSLANFAAVWQTMPLPRFFLNTLLLCGAAVALNLLFCSMAAYPLARMEFPGRRVVFALLLSTLMLPGHVGLIVNFVTLLRLRLVDTYAGVLLPGAVSVFGIFLLRQAFLTVPHDLEDAARIDGASEWTIWWRVMVPVISPALAVLALFEFVAVWNSFLWPLIVLKSPEKYPLAVGLLYLSGLFAHNTRAVAAGAVMMTLPILVVFLFTQRYFVRGLTLGAIR